VGTVKTPVPVQFFASIIFRDSCLLSDVESRLTERVAPISERTSVMPFTQSDYYCPEMGRGLSRYFVLFSHLAGREELRETKLQTNDIESSFSSDGRRSVNIDPGYIALEHVVLATTKGFSHRIYLGKGIYADLTLIFENGTYCGFRWTYPDYSSPEFILLLNGWREHYKRLLRCQRA
jgi:hypothetical protein